jgi:hypothetical protein
MLQLENGENLCLRDVVIHLTWVSKSISQSEHSVMTLDCIAMKQIASRSIGALFSHLRCDIANFCRSLPTFQ